MRCLYCGKELALLKRWTGGGEFCTDAHRLRYQEEYNQLALNRLLQAKPPTEEKIASSKNAPPAKEQRAAEPARDAKKNEELPRQEAAKPHVAAVAEPAAARIPAKIPEGVPAASTYRETPAAVAVYAEAPLKVEEPAPVAVHVEEDPGPAGSAGFLVEMPEPMLAEVSPISRPDIEFLAAVAAALPNHIFESLNGHQDSRQLETAGLLTYHPPNRASNYTTTGSRDRRLEVRDFVRTPPVVEIDVSPAGETGLETSSEAMDISFSPQPPQGAPPLWQEQPLGFAAGGTELGDLARLAFAAESDQAEPQRDTQQPSQDAVLAKEERPAWPVPLDSERESPDTAPAEMAQEPEAPLAGIPAPASEVVEEVVVESAGEPAAEALVEEVPPVIEQAPEPVAEAVTEQVPEPVAEPTPRIPAAVTKPLPLVLHVAAPGKAKTVQVFSSATSSVAIQVPQSTSLPLRAVMIFGPMPVKESEKAGDKKGPAAAVSSKSEAKAEPKKGSAVPAPVRIDARAVSAKFRQPDKAALKADLKEDKKPLPKVDESAMKQVAKAETPGAGKPSQKLDVKQDKKPEGKEVKVKEDVKPEKLAEPFPPSPLAAPYSGSGDLGLPSLSLEQSPGFLGRLPVLAKIGIVVALLAGLGTLIAYSSKSGGAAVMGGTGTVVVGAALPGDAGWITDWGADPGVRRTRQISILRSSQTLTDYRIEMQGQIETKAIGWVFRAADAKNFYVTKLEIVKPGLEPTVALVRFAVINGEEQAHAQLPLPLKVRRDTMYKIRFDAVGSSFTTYVQDEKVDHWSDDQVKSGGVGLYSERGEVATLKGGMSVLPLIVRK